MVVMIRVEVVEGDLEALEDVGAVARLLEVVLGPTSDDLASPVDVVLEDRLEGQRLRLPVHQRDDVRVEGELQRGVLEKVVEDLARGGIALALDDDAHPVPIRLVSQVGDALDLAGLHEIGDLLEERGLVDLVRDGRRDDGRAPAAGLLECDLCLHDDPPAAVGVHVPDRVDLLPLTRDRVATPVVAEDRAAGREVGPEEVLAELVVGELGVLDERLGRVDDLGKVVGRDVRRHPDRDAGRTVEEQVREASRQDRRLHPGAVVVLDEVDRVLVDVGEDLGGDRGHARLGVAHRGRRVAIDRAVVALAVDERVAQGEVLRHAHEGVVDRLIAVRVVLAHHIADDRRALPIATIRLRGPSRSCCTGSDDGRA